MRYFEPRPEPGAVVPLWLRVKTVKMPGLIRRIFVFAAVDGLLLQSAPSSEPPVALRIEYKSQKLTSVPSISAEDYSEKPHLESHGIIGEKCLTLLKTCNI